VSLLLSKCDWFSRDFASHGKVFKSVHEAVDYLQEQQQQQQTQPPAAAALSSSYQSADASGGPSAILSARGRGPSLGGDHQPASILRNSTWRRLSLDDDVA